MKKGFLALVAPWVLILMPPPVKAEIVYSVPGMDTVEVRKNLVYKKDGPDELKMDIYLPPKLAANELRPVVLFIHGSPLPKEWTYLQSHGRLIAASGLVGVIFTQRPVSGKVREMETAVSDVEAAIRFIRTNAADHHIDPDRVALWTFSGGGIHLNIGLRGETPYIRCMVSSCGVLDSSGLAARDGGTPQALEKFSPVVSLLKPPESIPSVLIVRSGLDRNPGLNAGIDLFVSRMLAIGGDVNLLVHPFGRHMFDASDDDDQSRDIVAAVIAFLKGHLNRAATFETKKAFLTLLSAGKIDAAREFVRTKLLGLENQVLRDALLSEDQLGDVASVLSMKKNANDIGLWEWLLELHPESIGGRWNLAFLYAMSGQREKAIAVAKKVLSLVDTDKSLPEGQKAQARQSMEGLIKDLMKELQASPGK